MRLFPVCCNAGRASLGSRNSIRWERVVCFFVCTCVLYGKQMGLNHSKWREESDNTYFFKMVYLNELWGTGMKDKPKSLFCRCNTLRTSCWVYTECVSVCVCFVYMQFAAPFALNFSSVVHVCGWLYWREITIFLNPVVILSFLFRDLLGGFETRFFRAVSIFS